MGWKCYTTFLFFIILHFVFFKAFVSNQTIMDYGLLVLKGLF